MKKPTEGNGVSPDLARIQAGCRQAADDAVTALCAHHQLVLPSRTAHLWRATKPTWGTHPVLPDREIQCILTDGMLMIAVGWDGRVYAELHVQWFVWSEREVIKTLVSYWDDEEKKNKTTTMVTKSGAPAPLVGKGRQYSRPARSAALPKPKTKKQLREQLLAEL
jgi:hypothetical protein